MTIQVNPVAVWSGFNVAIMYDDVPTATSNAWCL